MDLVELTPRVRPAGYLEDRSSFVEMVEAGICIGLLNGNGVVKSYSTAFEWFYESSKFRYPKAEAALGKLYNLGLGVPANQPLAYQWTLLAADGGDKDAQATLPLMTNLLSAADKAQAEAAVMSVLVSRKAK